MGSTVKSFHIYKDMRYFSFPLDNGTTVETCPAALGFSFAAGTTDGPGAFDFTQNDPGAPNNPLWSVVGGLLRAPSPRQVACQAPKPVLLDVGEMDAPYAWAPNVVDIQALRAGQLLVVVSPSEATTMAGRRWRAAVAAAASSELGLGRAPHVVLAGPANTYAHYVATPEEYAIQRYEGASTLYGPWQLPAYVNLTVENLRYLSPTAAAASAAPDPGPSPPDNRQKSLSFVPGVVQDGAPIGSAFGRCTALRPGKGPFPAAGGAVVEATFVGANPRNELRLGDTFAAVERLGGGGDGGSWTRVRDDADWDLVFSWKRTNWLLGYSEVVVSWETGVGEVRPEPGTYRLRYFGNAKSLLGKITAFSGASDSFELV